MTARVKTLRIEIAAGYPAFSYLVEIEGVGRGLFAAASAEEAQELATRINEYPLALAAIGRAQEVSARLKKQLHRLRQKQKKGGAA
jgi:hypothetical protein